VVVDEVDNQNRVLASFLLNYKSPTYSELLRKTMLLVKDQSGWKIAGEESRLASQSE